MARTYTWPDGSKNHTITWEQHLANTQGLGSGVLGVLGAPVKGSGPQVPLSQSAPISALAQTPGPVPANPLKGLDGTNPPAPDTSGVSAQPVDPNVLNAQLIGNRNIALGKANAAYDTGNLSFDYGYNPDGTVNTANPYSRAALYQLGYERQQAGTTNGFAARGQLYSGAIQNQRDFDAGNYAQQAAANRLGYQRAVHGVQTGVLGTVANAGTGVSDADFAALLKSTYPGS